MRKLIVALIVLVVLAAATSAQATAPVLKSEGVGSTPWKIKLGYTLVSHGSNKYRIQMGNATTWYSIWALDECSAEPCKTEWGVTEGWTEPTRFRIQPWEPEGEYSNVVETKFPLEATGAAGKVKYRAETGKSGAVSSWDAYDKTEWEPWIEKHVPYLKAYPSKPAKSSTRWLDVGLPASTIIQGYWDWPAEELEGGPFAPLTAERRTSFINNRVKGTIEAGYDGIWLDDVNWHVGWRDQKQEGGPPGTKESYPENPTGEELKEPETKELKELNKDIRTNIGESHLLVANSEFIDVRRMLLANTSAEKTAQKTALFEEFVSQLNIWPCEYGVSHFYNATLYKEFFEFVSKLHEKGVQVEMLPTSTEEGVNAELFRKEHQFNLATYLLFNEAATNLKTGRTALGGDFIGGKEMTPMPGGNTNPEIAGSLKPESKKFWRGYELNLGSSVEGAEGKYKRETSGLWVRNFTGGIVYALEPGATETETPAAPRELEKIDGTKVTKGAKVKLKASEGLVLIG